ncbi:MAG: fibronectin type III domain-containing protein [Sulfuricaulis sp.]
MFRNKSLSGIRKSLCQLGLIVLSGWAPISAHANNGKQVFAAQIPAGTVRVLVLIMNGQWPAGGLSIEDGHGAVLMAHVGPDQQAQAALDAVAQRALAAMQHPPAMSAAHVKAARAIMALRLVSDWNFARAAGLGVELPPMLHPRSIRVVLLNAKGKPAATLGTVDVHRDHGPPAPEELRAQAAPAGITLRWRMATHAQAVPAYAYVVARDQSTDHAVLTLHPQLLTMQKPGQAVPYVDHAPPVNSTLTYGLSLVDVLGVASAPTTVKVYAPDFEAGQPPTDQTAKPGRGSVTLAWKPVLNPRTRALVVERSQLINGPYEILTPQGLGPDASQFEDHQIMPGASYYYRVRAVMPDGNLGPATDPVHAQPLSATTLAAPEGLAADVGISQISLTWRPVPGVSLAGYFIERRAAASSPRWFRLNGRLLPEPRYLDAVGPSQGGAFEYRVTAVATDEGASVPSKILHVQLRDTVPPSPPHVLSTSGGDGRVEIRFNAAEPAEKTAQVVLLRSDSSTEDGLVVGAPVPGSSGVITDDWVNGGQVYWYRLVAFDKTGNRSQQGQAFQVRVGAVKLPMPKAPKVTYTEQPAPEVKLTFDPPPPHARVIVEVQLADGRWQHVSGPTTGASAVDLEPPGTHAHYRIVYVGEAGGIGPPSPTSSPR